RPGTPEADQPRKHRRPRRRPSGQYPEGSRRPAKDNHRTNRPATRRNAGNPVPTLSPQSDRLRIHHSHKGGPTVKKTTIIRSSAALLAGAIAFFGASVAEAQYSEDFESLTGASPQDFAQPTGAGFIVDQLGGADPATRWALGTPGQTNASFLVNGTR